MEPELPNPVPTLKPRKIPRPQLPKADPPPSTFQEVEARSISRARQNTWRITALALVGLFSLLTLAYLLQGALHDVRDAQEELHDFAHAQCEQRQANALRTNSLYDQLARLSSSPEEAQVYRSAKLLVPDCRN